MRKNNKTIRKMTLIFIFSVGIVILVTITILVGIVWLLRLFKVITNENISENAWLITFLFIISSIGLGLFLSFVCSQIILKPINKLVSAMSNLSDGDYNVKIDLGKVEPAKDLANCFNNLATELQNTEILKSDFINNFSHELKTPIVSISGLVKLMRSGNLSIEKQKEYLNIIDDEINRLSSMTTNVLNLSKIQNQTILTNKTTFNLSEQIRTCVLLLEKKWSQKSLELSLDFEEFYVSANEDMLKQVWFNLIDNAIKFSLKNKALIINISRLNNYIKVDISNYGPSISNENMTKIFNKFYQVDSTHSTEGNGIGLSIVKHIVDLHRGKISVECSEGLTTFSVEFPC